MGTDRNGRTGRGRRRAIAAVASVAVAVGSLGVAPAPAGAAEPGPYDWLLSPFQRWVKEAERTVTVTQTVVADLQRQSQAWVDGGTMGAAEGGRQGRRRGRGLARVAAGIAVLVAASVLPATPAGADPWQDLLRNLGLAPAAPPTAPPAGTTATATAPTCGGQAVAKAGTTQLWTCTLAQEFDGTTLDPSVWTVQETAKSGFNQGGACFVNHPENIRVTGGALQLTTRREAAPFTCQSSLGSFSTQHTAATEMTFAKFTQTYGRFEIRAKMPATRVPGVQFAYSSATSSSAPTRRSSAWPGSSWSWPAPRGTGRRRGRGPPSTSR